MLQLQNVHLRRGAQQALHGVDFELKPGELVGILGSNGAGKSTLLAMLAGELRPDQGSALLDGKPLAEIKPHDLARRRALLPQMQPQPFELTAEEVVAMGSYPWPECPPAGIAALIHQALHDADISELRHRPYPTLSGGEAMRVQFARMLVQIRAGQTPTPRYLLLDEPTAYLDPKHQNQLLASVRELSREDTIGVAAVLHDINLAARWCDRLVLLKQGKVVSQGPVAGVFTHDILETAFDCPVEFVPAPHLPARKLALLG